MKKALIICDQNMGTLRQSALELLTVMHDSNVAKVVLAFGPGSDKLKESVAGYGAQRLYFCQSEMISSGDLAASVTALCKAEGVDFILATSSAFNREYLPRVAVQIDAGIITDCTEISIGESPIIRRPMYAGKCTTRASFTGDSSKIVLMRPNQLPIKVLSGGTCESIALTIVSAGLASTIKEVIRGTSAKLDLTEAPVIVSGGRGLKGPENFKMIEALADVLGASVGASRAVCDAGWMPHSIQVGQTGKTVAPNLYIAVGISGAIQHLAGMSGSKVVVAINSDANAPIFQKATYGIVGDAFKIVPLLTEEFKKILQ